MSLLDWLAAAGCLPLLLGLLLWATGHDRGPVLVVFVGFAPYLLLLGPASLVLAVLTGAPWLAVLAATPTVGWAVATWWEVRPGPGAARGRPANVPAAPSLRIVTANLFYGNDAGRRSWDVIAAERPDVVLLQEVSSASGGWLPPEGWHAQVLSRDEDAFGTAILSRWPLRAAAAVSLGGLPQLRAEVDVGGRIVVVWCVHPRAPTTIAADRLWRRQLGELSAQLCAERGEWILAGDVNATGLHGPFRALLRETGSLDARPARPSLLHTWPSRRIADPPALARLLCLDHVLVRGPRVRAVRRLPAAASDHHPLCVDIELT